MAAGKVGKKAASGRPKSAKPKVEEPIYLCPYCNTEKKKSEFYVSTDTTVLTGVTRSCKECARKVAMNYNEKTKEYMGCTKISLQDALYNLDKPFIANLYDTCYIAINDPTNTGVHKDLWSAYITKITSLPQYKTLRWRDGDLYAQNIVEVQVTTKDEIDKNEEIKKEYQTNRKDVIRMIGYDPFGSYPVEEDKPVLYAQLINFIDEETKNDGMKMNAVLQIVQSFNQIQKINDAVNDLISDPQKLNNNNGIVKQHADTISKFLSGANALAKDNGISVNHNNSKSKGANTLTGKMKELDLIGFRDAKINMYDVDYCKGMQQVAEISAKAQIDQIGFDENVVNDINAIRRELVDDLQKQRDKAVERARILLVENKDLKDFLKEKGLIDEFGKVIEIE